MLNYWVSSPRSIYEAVQRDSSLVNLLAKENVIEGSVRRDNGITLNGKPVVSKLSVPISDTFSLILDMSLSRGTNGYLVSYRDGENSLWSFSVRPGCQEFSFTYQVKGSAQQNVVAWTNSGTGICGDKKKHRFVIRVQKTTAILVVDRSDLGTVDLEGVVESCEVGDGHSCTMKIGLVDTASSTGKVFVAMLDRAREI